MLQHALQLPDDGMTHAQYHGMKKSVAAQRKMLQHEEKIPWLEEQC